MNLINRIRVNLFYKELKSFSHLNIDKLFKIKGFKNAYNDVIKKIVNFASARNYSPGDSDKYIIFMSHLDSTLLLERYLDTLENVDNYFNNLDLLDLFKDKNFYEIYNKFRRISVPDNINKLIREGLSDRLIYFLEISNNYPVNYEQLIVLNDPYWDLFKHDFSLGETSFLVRRYNDEEVLNLIVQNNAMEGIKYSYQNIPESHHFIEVTIGKKNPFMFQFDMEFINTVTPELLNMLYKKRTFYENEEGKALYEIYKLGNIELIEDLTYFDPVNLSFTYLDKSDYGKSLLESNYFNHSKNHVFLSKYFGINVHQFGTYKVLVDTFSKIDNIPEDLKNKYGSMLELLHYGYYASKEDLIKLSKSFDFESRDVYQQLLVDMELDFNNLLRKEFTSELKNRNEKNKATANKTQVDGVDVYEFNGNNFTMLVHAVVSNNMSSNNGYVSQIVNDPSKWESITDGNIYLSTSLISEQYMVTYGIPDKNDTVMFGFTSLEPSMVKIMDTADLGVNRNTKSTEFTFRQKLGKNDVNTVTTVDDFISKTVKNNKGKGASQIWNEVLIDRVNPRTQEKLRPDYVVCMDYITPNSIKAAKYFDVPIYLINRKAYRKDEVVELENIEENVKSL